MITITFFLPVIIEEFGVSTLVSNLLSAIPYGCALILMMINAVHSDITKERYTIAICCDVYFNSPQVQTYYYSMRNYNPIWWWAIFQYDNGRFFVFTHVLDMRLRIWRLGDQGTAVILLHI